MAAVSSGVPRVLFSILRLVSLLKADDIRKLAQILSSAHTIRHLPQFKITSARISFQSCSWLFTADVIARYGVLEVGVHLMQKPFTIKNLADKVREVLESRPSGTYTL